jgi:hypothetical protein
MVWRILSFVDRTYRYNRVKENQLAAQLFLTIFLQPLHVSGVRKPIIRGYNRIYTTWFFFTRFGECLASKFKRGNYVL